MLVLWASSYWLYLRLGYETSVDSTGQDSYMIGSMPNRFFIHFWHSTFPAEERDNYIRKLTKAPQQASGTWPHEATKTMVITRHQRARTG